MASLPLEICVDDLDDAWAAVEAGADRIELCAALALGGLTPSPGAMLEAAALPVPVHAMIRPRTGDYVFDARARAVMERELEAVHAAGLAGVVVGASRPDGSLDRAVLEPLCARARALELSVTLHRAFDLTPDPLRALELAVELGCARILSSGQASAALDGAPVLARMVEAAAGRVAIMAGAGVNARTVDALLDQVWPDELHASCKVRVPGAFAERRGGPKDTDFGRQRTDPAGVRALRERIDRREPPP